MAVNYVRGPGGASQGSVIGTGFLASAVNTALANVMCAHADNPSVLLAFGLAMVSMAASAPFIASSRWRCSPVGGPPGQAGLGRPPGSMIMALTRGCRLRRASHCSRSSGGSNAGDARAAAPGYLRILLASISTEPSSMVVVNAAETS
jgi:hypothetical protein